MLKTKLNYFLIFLLLLNGFIYSQTKDYKKLYHDLAKNNKNAHEKIDEFFGSLNDDELVEALSVISKDKNADFIAYNLLIPNNKKLEESKFRRKIIKELSKTNNSSAYKIVLIGFVSKYRKKDDDHVEELNDELLKVAESKDNSDKLRFYAASKYGISKDFDKTHTNLKKMFMGKNLKVKNGTAKAIRKFLYSTKISDAERSNWEDLLISEINQNKSDLNKVGSMLSTLSLTKTNKSKKYILDLFDDNASTNPEISDKLVSYLSNETDVEILNKVFTEYSKHEHFNNFGSELKLKHIVNENDEVVEKLYNGKTVESKLNYLRAVKYVKVEKREYHLEKVRESLSSESEVERLECIKTLHFLLHHEEEDKVFKEHIRNENSNLVKNQIYFYVGK